MIVGINYGRINWNELGKSVRNMVVQIFVWLSVSSAEWAMHTTKLATDSHQDIFTAMSHWQHFRKATSWSAQYRRTEKIHKLQTVAQRSLKPFLNSLL